ncbi:polysaccharide biosynthesis tyrosine autokinase [Flavobacteriaceae bacterium D16]|nr:polysaccharide biosynthesis tyrosine autokinase [Flavobacteriaceae bacterium D16]
MNAELNKIAENGDDVKEIMRPYLKQWIWFVLSLFLAIALAIIHIRYTTPEYQVNAKIQILKDQNSTSELSAFKDLNLLSGGNVDVEDEVEILNSRTNFIRVVKELKLNVKVQALGRIHSSELYTSPPVKVNFLIPDSVVSKSKLDFNIEITSPTTFRYEEEGDEGPGRSYSFGNTISSSIGDFVILPLESNLDSYINDVFKISIKPVERVASSYQNKLKVSVSNEMSNIISLSLNDPVIHKAIDILNVLLDTYNRDYIDEKKEIADKTAEFIDDRIADIYGELSSVDKSAVDYKESKGITDVAAQSTVNYEESSASRQELQDARLQLSIATGMKNLLDNQQEYDVLPANMAYDPTIVNSTAKFNELVLERKRLLKSSNEKNPIIVNIDQQLEGLKRSLNASLSSLSNTLNMRVNNLSSQLSQINARIYAAPGNEQALRDIERERQTAEALYLYLLQKREEAQITYASTAPKSKIIDRPYGTSPFPVSPKVPIIMLAAIILGALVPIAVIYVRELLDNKVINKIGLEKIVGEVPVLAEIPKIKKKEGILVKAEGRSIMAESLRILRANLDYLIKTRSKSKKGNVIFVTSSVSGEGKTLVSSNLAMIYSKANKKVLLLGADIRNPKLYKFFSGKNVDELGRRIQDKDTKGLTDFLVDESLEIRDMIYNMLVYDQTVDVIFSGKVPPNPSELLMSNRVGLLIDELRNKYDYIIVDTAPVMGVSDTLLISEHADQTLFVTRAHQTDLKVLEFALKLHKEGKIKNISFIVNGVKDSNLGYGGPYGYGYGKTTKKKWWKLTG